MFSSPSSLVSVSKDGSAKFWKIGADNVITNTQLSTSLSSARVESISLQARDGVAVSCDSAGVVKIWDISTGACKASVQTPAGRSDEWSNRGARVIDNRSIFICYKDDKIHIWEAEKSELLKTVDITPPDCLKISGDGSKIICLSDGIIQAWSMWTWELVCKIESSLEGTLYLDTLCTYTPRIWICSRYSSGQEGWDFGTSGSSPVPFDPSTGRPHLDFISGSWWQINDPSWIKDTSSGKRVFQLSGKYTMPNDVQWDGQFLVAGYSSGEVWILDFHYILGQDK